MEQLTVMKLAGKMTWPCERKQEAGWKGRWAGTSREQEPELRVRWGTGTQCRQEGEAVMGTERGGGRAEEQTGKRTGPHWLLTKHRGQGYRRTRNNLQVSSINTAACRLYEKDQEEGQMGDCIKLIKQQREDFSGGVQWIRICLPMQGTPV